MGGIQSTLKSSAIATHEFRSVLPQGESVFNNDTDGNYICPSNRVIQQISENTLVDTLGKPYSRNDSSAVEKNKVKTSATIDLSNCSISHSFRLSPSVNNTSPNAKSKNEKQLEFDVHLQPKLHVHTVERKMPEEATSQTESVRKAAAIKSHTSVISEILDDFLYVGNMNVAQNVSLLKNVGITHVIDCCPEISTNDIINGKCSITSCTNQVDRFGDFESLHLILRDTVNEDLTPFICQVIDFVLSAIGKNKLSNHHETGDTHMRRLPKIFVFCHLGVSRSCAIAIAIVMYIKPNLRNFKEAFDYVKGKRSICSPNSGFICQLIEWEQQLKNWGVLADKNEIHCLENENLNAKFFAILRLAPHANYDPNTLVLKYFFERNSRRRVKLSLQCQSEEILTQELDNLKLWAEGLYVLINEEYARILVWVGLQCKFSREEINYSIAMAQQIIQAKQALQITNVDEKKTSVTTDLQAGQIVQMKQNSCISSFGSFLEYGAEMQWLQQKHNDAELLASKPLHKIDNDVIFKPKLYVYQTDVIASMNESNPSPWELWDNYEQEDLIAERVFLLYSPKKSYLWIGEHNRSSKNILNGQAEQFIEKLSEFEAAFCKTDSIGIEYRGDESESFWELWDQGY